MLFLCHIFVGLLFGIFSISIVVQSAPKSNCYFEGQFYCLQARFDRGMLYGKGFY